MCHTCGVIVPNKWAMTRAKHIQKWAGVTGMGLDRAKMA